MTAKTANTNIETDIIILGGGLIGLVTALAAAEAGFKVVIVEEKKPELHWSIESVDARVSAINTVSQRILANLNIWSELPKSSYSVLQRLVVWDQLGGSEIDFDSADLGIAECGYVVENRAIIKALWERLQVHAAVQIYCPAKAKNLWSSKEKILLTLLNDQQIEAKLVIGADGRRSWVREQMQVNVTQKDYQQQAIVCVVQSEKPHQKTAWQNFLITGPIAYLPLTDDNRGAIVWSTTNSEADRLLQLPGHRFDNEITNTFDSRLGNLTTVGAKKAIPLVMLRAEDYVNERIALVGDAAHTIHPLAGQGANLGIFDAACLVEVLQKAAEKKQDIGNLQTLRRYQRRCKLDNWMMQAAMTGFNQLFSNSEFWLVPVRSYGLNLANRISCFKKYVMKYAMGEHGELPRLAEYTN